MTSSLISDLL